MVMDNGLRLRTVNFAVGVASQVNFGSAQLWLLRKGWLSLWDEMFGLPFGEGLVSRSCSDRKCLKLLKHPRLLQRKGAKSRRSCACAVLARSV